MFVAEGEPSPGRDGPGATDLVEPRGASSLVARELAYRARAPGTTLKESESKETIVFLAEIFGPDLLIVVIVVAVLVFGGSAIPKLARNLGSAKTEFEKGLKAAKSTDAKATDVTDEKTTDTNS